MPMKEKRVAITIKNEGTYGVDATPAAATDAMLVQDWEFTDMENAYEQRTLVRPYFANEGQIVVASMCKGSFAFEMAGAGAAGTAPKYAPMFKASALAETISAGTDVQYDPVTVGESSASLYFYKDGRLHKVLGLKGDIGWKIAAGGKPMWTFDFIGLHVAPTDVAMVTPVHTGWTKPLAVNNANTTPFTLHGFAGKFSSFSGKLGNSMQYRNVPGQESVLFVGRTTKGQIELDAELIATKDWFATIKAETTGAFTVTQGATAGNKVKIDGPVVQLANYRETKRNGLLIAQMDMEFKPSTNGNDEIKFTIS